jgi:glycosyltransferase involved in cell wall biosynthesis
VRIAHVITFGELSQALDMGGAQIDTVLSLRHQMEHNEVELITGCTGPLLQVCEEEGIAFRVIPISNRTFAPLMDVRSVVALWRHFRRTRPNIVHTHCSKAGVVGRIAAQLAGVPIVVHTIHSNSFHGRQSRYVYHALRLTERVCAMIADQLIAVSEITAREFADAGVCSLDRVKIVVSGIDFSRFPALPYGYRDQVRAAVGIDSSDRMVVSVANLMRDKGHEVLVEAAGIIATHESNVKFLIVGTGPMEGDIRDRVHRAGLDGTVILTGGRSDVPQILASADVFVQMSHREGLSRSLVEALYSYLPVVATDVGGTMEVVTHGETGLLVNPGSAQELADSVKLLLGSPPLAERLGANAHEAVSHGRTVGAMTSALDQIYSDLAAEKGIANQARSVRTALPAMTRPEGAVVTKS